MPGTVHALVGENGAGKSTLIKILSGALSADSGELFFKGELHRGFSTREALDLGISVIYQELALVSQMTVAENIFLGREPRNAFGLINHADSAVKSFTSRKTPVKLTFEKQLTAVSRKGSGKNLDQS